MSTQKKLFEINENTDKFGRINGTCLIQKELEISYSTQLKTIDFTWEDCEISIKKKHEAQELIQFLQRALKTMQ